MAGADRHTSVTSPPDAPRLPSGHSRNSRQSTTTGNVAEAGGGGGGKGGGRGGSPPNTNSKMKRKNNQQQQEEEEDEDEDEDEEEEMNQSDPDVATNISKKKCVSQLKLHQLPNSKLLVSVMFSCQRSHKNELKHETKPRK